MLNLPLLLACLQVLLAGTECKIILMGGSPGSEAKVLTIYWITVEEGQLLWAVNSAQKPPCACVASNLQPGKNRPGVQRMAQCGNGETAKHPHDRVLACNKARQENLRRPSLCPAWGTLLGLLSFGIGLPQGAGANETKPRETG